MGKGLAGFGYLGLIGVLALGAGCGQKAQRIDPGGTQTITTTGEIDIQDWRDAAADMTQSLLASGVLARKEGGDRPLVAISSFVNNTTQQVDPDLLLKKIRTVLSQSGKAYTITTVGLTGEAEDAPARRVAEGEKPPEPDYTLTLKIIEQSTRADRTRQSAFVFQMSLTDPKKGYAVWEDETTIVKQGTKPGVGW